MAMATTTAANDNNGGMYTHCLPMSTHCLPTRRGPDALVIAAKLDGFQSMTMDVSLDNAGFPIHGRGT